MALDMLKRQVEKRGVDYLYPRRRWDEIPSLSSHDAYDPNSTICVNWFEVDGKREPDCIMGHVYQDMGVLHLVPATVDLYGATISLSVAGILLTARAQRVFFTAQTAQDRGEPWGLAVLKASEYVTDDHYDDKEYRVWGGMAAGAF